MAARGGIDPDVRLQAPFRSTCSAFPVGAPTAAPLGLEELLQEPWEFPWELDGDAVS